MLEELFHAVLAIAALTVVISLIWVGVAGLPLGPLLFGEAIGAPAGIALLTLTSPRRRR